jgi:hypothetical protein
MRSNPSLRAALLGLCANVVAAGEDDPPVGDAEPNVREPPSPIVGVWASVDRHAAMGSLFQPVHGVRKREAVVYFLQDADGLKGYTLLADHKDITFQEAWTDGRTHFRNVTFQGDRLTFDVDFDKWRMDAGPIAVEEGRLENAGAVRVKARLDGDRLVGTWGIFIADGTEVFRGEWEATRMLGGPALGVAMEEPRLPLADTDRLSPGWSARRTRSRCVANGGSGCVTSAATPARRRTWSCSRSRSSPASLRIRRTSTSRRSS